MSLDRGVVTAAYIAPERLRRVFVDTTVVVEAMTSDQTASSDAAAMLEALERAGAEIVYSRLLDVESLQAAAYLAGAQATGIRRSGLRDGRVRRRSRRIAAELRTAWQEYLDRNRWRRIELGDVADDIHDVMFATGLSSYDAVHAASAIAADCDAIATLDSDFGRLPATQVPTIITAPRRLARTRRLRASA